jgi:hypothetical protein
LASEEEGKDDSISGISEGSHSGGKKSHTSIGFLLPLSGGHSGPYSIVEKHLYEAYLSKAGFL